MLIWSKWDDGKLDMATTTASAWHGGDGQIPGFGPSSTDPLSWESDAPDTDDNKTGDNGSVMGPNGRCVVRLVGRSGDEVDSPGIVYAQAVPQIMTASLASGRTIVFVM